MAQRHGPGDPNKLDFMFVLLSSTSFQGLTDSARSMSLETVTIRVDDPPVDVLVYKSLIAHVAPYFRGAFEHAFREADEGVVCLPDVSESTFRIFLSWMHAQLFEGGSTSPNFGPDLSTLNQSSGEVTNITVPYEEPSPSLFDTNTFREIMDQDVDVLNQRYYENPDWLAWHEATLISLLLLYIFADKYSVHQLRDDIMSAAMGHVLAWNWWPGLAHLTLINKACEHLPSTAQFLRFLTSSVAYVWDRADDDTCRRFLAEMPQSFLVEVMIIQAHLIAQLHSLTGVSGALEEDIPNSCTFHEHLVRDQDQCRQRLASCGHVFTGILNACAKEAEKTLAVHSSFRTVH